MVVSTLAWNRRVGDLIHGSYHLFCWETSSFYVCMYEFNKVVRCNYILKSCSLWMYWQKYLQWFYSDDAARWKAALLNVKGTDPLKLQVYIWINHERLHFVGGAMGWKKMSHIYIFHAGVLKGSNIYKRNIAMIFNQSELNERYSYFHIKIC